MFTRRSSEIIWRFPFTAEKNPKANVSRERCRRYRSKQWRRIGKPFRPVLHISSARTLPGRATFDSRAVKGAKNWEWIKKGVPIRVEIGPRDIESGSVVVSRRDQPVKAKQSTALREFAGRAAEILGEMQEALYTRAQKFRDANTKTIESRKE